MKKLFVLLMTLGFFVSACNNNKTGKNKNLNNRDKDDYGKTDNPNTNDEKKNEENNGNNVNDNKNNSLMTGWPQVEKDAFITNCEREAMAGGTISRSVAQNYCDCMLNKMETLIPDIQDVAKLTQEDMESPAMKKMATDCLNGN
jgi:hypothetical protein